MADLRKEIHGPNSLKGVDLAVIAYDNRVAKKDGAVTTHYLDARIHPGDRRAAGQTTLALVAKPDPKSPSKFNNSVRYSVSQFEQIVEAAGDNVTELTNRQGEVVGKIYGVKADLLINGSDVILNSKTLEASEQSVAPDKAGRTITDQIFDAQAAAKAAKEAAKAPAATEAAVETPAVEEPAVEEPKAEAPKAKATAAKKPAARKPATRKPAAPKPELVGATAGAPAVDEPGLG